jgi:transposase
MGAYVGRLGHACPVGGGWGAGQRHWQLWSQRLPAATLAVVSWVGSLPGPVAVAYEAGPTGFGLARALQAAGMRCVVVAPSKLERPPGDRVKTDRRDAERLARLLHIGELPQVRVPTEAEEASRDLVWAREDARADLMRARHRLSKLLLRHGLVWQAAAWTQAHEQWLGTLRLGQQRGLGSPSTRPMGRCWPPRHAATAWTPPRRVGRHPALGAAGRPAGLPARGRGPDRARAGGGDRRLAALHRRLSRAGPNRALQRSSARPGVDHQDRQQPCPTVAGRGSLPSRKPYRLSRELQRRQAGQPAVVRERAEPGNRRLHQRWGRLDARGKRSTISVVAVARELAGWCWSLAVLDA